MNKYWNTKKYILFKTKNYNLEFNLPALVEGRREPTKHNPTHTNILNDYLY